MSHERFVSRFDWPLDMDYLGNTEFFEEFLYFKSVGYTTQKIKFFGKEEIFFQIDRKLMVN